MALFGEKIIIGKLCLAPLCEHYSGHHWGLVGSAPAWDGTGCEFDSWQCRIYIPCSLSLYDYLGTFGSLGI